MSRRFKDLLASDDALDTLMFLKDGGIRDVDELTSQLGKKRTDEGISVLEDCNLTARPGNRSGDGSKDSICLTIDGVDLASLIIEAGKVLERAESSHGSPSFLHEREPSVGVDDICKEMHNTYLLILSVSYINEHRDYFHERIAHAHGLAPVPSHTEAAPYIPPDRMFLPYNDTYEMSSGASTSMLKSSVAHLKMLVDIYGHDRYGENTKQFYKDLVRFDYIRMPLPDGHEPIGITKLVDLARNAMIHGRSSDLKRFTTKTGFDSVDHFLKMGVTMDSETHPTRMAYCELDETVLGRTRYPEMNIILFLVRTYLAILRDFDRWYRSVIEGGTPASAKKTLFPVLMDLHDFRRGNWIPEEDAP